MILRILTGIWAGILFVFFLLLGGWPFVIFIGALAVLAFLELISMKKIKRSSIESIFGVITVFLIVIKAWKSPPFLGWLHPTELFMGLVLLLLLLTVFSKNRVNIDQATYIVFSVLYVGYGFSYLVALRDKGLALVFFIQIVIWATDTGAYFIGKKFGRRKLAPAISPNKTVEGMAGGLVVALITAFVFRIIVDHKIIDPFHLILITCLISVFGQLGDLAESALKRYYDVKDSGKILPGHGGILDRFDSLIFVLPLLHVVHLL